MVDQNEDNKLVVNRNKQVEETILRMLDGMRLEPTIDQRWLTIGRTHIEEGFMAVNRAVFKPERVKLASDNGEDAELDLRTTTVLPEKDGLPKTTVIDNTSDQRVDATA